jgi:hypothetical protein
VPCSTRATSAGPPLPAVKRRLIGIESQKHHLPQSESVADNRRQLSRWTADLAALHHSAHFAQNAHRNGEPADLLAARAVQSFGRAGVVLQTAGGPLRADLDQLAGRQRGEATVGGQHFAAALPDAQHQAATQLEPPLEGCELLGVHRLQDAALAGRDDDRVDGFVTLPAPRQIPRRLDLRDGDLRGLVPQPPPHSVLFPDRRSQHQNQLLSGQLRRRQVARRKPAFGDRLPGDRQPHRQRCTGAAEFDVLQ